MKIIMDYIYMHCKTTADTTYMDTYMIPLHKINAFKPLYTLKYNRVTSQWFCCTLIRQNFSCVCKFRPLMQFYALQMAFSRTRENQNKTFKNQIKCVISRTSCFLRTTLNIILFNPPGLFFI